MTELPTLWQLRFSHYNEKARWALDHKGVPHRRRTSLPVLHAFRAQRMTGKRTMPILLVDGVAIRDSARIIDALEARSPEPALYPADPAARRRALDLQRYFDREVGPHVRRLFFFHMLADEPEAVCEAYTRPVGRATRAAYTAAFPLAKAAMRRALSIDPVEAERSLEHSRAGLERIEAELGDGEYLSDGSFAVADLAAAALYFPLVRPPEYQYEYPRRWSERYEELRSALAARPAFAWIEEMWRRHRGRSAEVPG